MGRPQPHSCFLAQALDAIGSGLALLIVHELLEGPKTDEELRRSLSDVAPDGMAAILSSLLRAGIIRHVASGSAGADAHELTELGRAAAPVVDALEAWGRSLPGQLPPPSSGAG